VFVLGIGPRLGESLCSMMQITQLRLHRVPSVSYLLLLEERYVDVCCCAAPDLR
jgi:hypothetical protein